MEGFNHGDNGNRVVPYEVAAAHGKRDLDPLMLVALGIKQTIATNTLAMYSAMRGDEIQSSDTHKLVLH